MQEYLLCTEVVPRIRSAIPAAAKPIGGEDASDSGIQLEKKKLALALQEFMGANILAESIKEPRWRDNVMAGRERQAVRAARL